jgi:S-adenosylmethionine:tRNA ribosyltransferase-isomerase
MPVTPPLLHSPDAPAPAGPERVAAELAAKARQAGLDFEIPPELEAAEPAEARGLARDDVRLMVSHYRDDTLQHTHFSRLPEYLAAGDVLIINTSGTLPAALMATRADGTSIELHLSTRVPPDRAPAEAPGGPVRWVVELRQFAESGTESLYTASAGEIIALPGGASALLEAPYATLSEGRVRLWVAALSLSEPVPNYLEHHGFPIRYSYVRAPWPASAYQTVYATEAGSAEMPSAGRAFTPEIITRLVARGVTVAPLLLHTGVASPEAFEPPYAEFYRVPPSTARLVNSARRAGQRVIAVGTTVVRALETVAQRDGTVRSGEGWTDLVISPARGLRVISGLLTGLHEPRASHLAMLAAVAGYEHLRPAYAEALRQRYLWHEFGDLHLLLP